MKVVLKHVKLADSVVEPVPLKQKFTIVVSVKAESPGVPAAEVVTLACRTSEYSVKPSRVSIKIPEGKKEHTKNVKVELDGPEPLSADPKVRVTIAASAGKTRSVSVWVTKAVAAPKAKESAP